MYSGVLLPVLAEHLDLVAVSPEPIEWGGRTLSPDEVNPADHDVLLHFLADSLDHLFAYRSALRLGGVVVCHDLMIPHLLGTFAPEEEAADLAEHLGADRATHLLGRRARGVASHKEVYLLQVVNRAVRRADAAIVHSRFAKFTLESEVPGLAVHHVPSHTGAVPRDLGDPAELRDRLGLPAHTFLVGLFGNLGGHKRVTEALSGFAAAVPAARRNGVQLGLLLVGAEVGMDLNAAVASHGLAGVATVRGAVDDRSFFEHMAAIDAFVGLRYPTLGESSATMLQAMRLGKPVITTDHAQFGEEQAAIRIAPDANEVDHIARAIVSLATCARCRSVATQGSLTRAAESSLDRAVEGYMSVIESAARSGYPVGPKRGATSYG